MVWKLEIPLPLGIFPQGYQSGIPQILSHCEIENIKKTLCGLRLKVLIASCGPILENAKNTNQCQD